MTLLASVGYGITRTVLIWMGSMRGLGTKNNDCWVVKETWRPTALIIEILQDLLTTILLPLTSTSTYSVVQEQRPNESDTSMQVVGGCIGGVFKVGTLLVRVRLSCAIKVHKRAVAS